MNPEPIEPLTAGEVSMIALAIAFTILIMMGIS